MVSRKLTFGIAAVLVVVCCSLIIAVIFRAPQLVPEDFSIEFSGYSNSNAQLAITNHSPHSVDILYYTEDLGYDTWPHQYYYLLKDLKPGEWRIGEVEPYAYAKVWTARVLCVREPDFREHAMDYLVAYGYTNTLYTNRLCWISAGNVAVQGK